MSIHLTPSAYSVEEHMFQQDEIQKRHPQQPADQQRSEPVTEIVFGPNNLSQSEQEWRAIAAGNRLAEQVMFWHTKDCNVHAPTLKPCSCGLETRMRDEIKRLRAEPPQQPPDQQRSDTAEQIYEYCMSCMGVSCWLYGKTDITAGIQRILNGEKP